jgi:hypothetical protein
VKYDSVIKNHEAYIELLRADAAGKILQQRVSNNGHEAWYDTAMPIYGSQDYVKNWRVKPEPRSVWRVERVDNTPSNMVFNSLEGAKHHLALYDRPDLYRITEFVEKT